MNYEQIMKLALERGFYFPSCEIYNDAQAGFWEYGPNGVSLKNKFVELWRREMVRRDGMLEIDGSQIMSSSVFEASGHLASFADPVVQCNSCKSIYRADKLIYEIANEVVPENADLEDFDKAISEHNVVCTKCKGKLGKTRKFNMMFKVGIGPEAVPSYMRPETCQSLFVDFPRLFKVMRGKLPVGLAQVGKSFRNEISPRQSLIRMREFYQAEIEVAFNPKTVDAIEGFKEVEGTEVGLMVDEKKTERMTLGEAVEKKIVPNKLIAYYLGLLVQFYHKAGVDVKRSRFRKLGAKEKAFYASVAFDFEVETSIGWLELVACNDRADYDLTAHGKKSGTNFEVLDGEEKVLPHIFELSMGIDRSLYTIIEHNIRDEKENDRVVLSIKPYLAPVHLGVLPLMKKDGMYEKADEIYSKLKTKYDVFFDAAGSVGKRYRRLDEIGCPLAVTIDYQTMEDGTVTIRKRDAMSQERIKVSDIEAHVQKETSFP
ncbi:MAG: glycine--tRNA ligase [Candidatus Micrarchaeota archaeon]|nr:glycine--tRNA ligase [Candidatus Micrarchaeota archaeon]